MLNFENLEFEEEDIAVVDVSPSVKYIIGCDPIDNMHLTDNKEKEVYVYSIYDLENMRITTRIKTTKLFNEFCEWYLSFAGLTKKNYSISNKFINKETNKPLTIDEIRRNN